MLIKDFADEYERYRTAGERAMAQISDEVFNHIPVAEGNSIAMIARHVGGNLVSRFTDFTTTDGEKPSRNRDGEFADGPFSRDEVLALWTRGFDTVKRELTALTDDDASKTVTIRGVGLSVHEALCRSIAHVAMHVGQIILLAKIGAGGQWKTLSIPKGKSAEYNANPKYEKASSYVAAVTGNK